MRLDARWSGTIRNTYGVAVVEFGRLLCDGHAREAVLLRSSMYARRPGDERGEQPCWPINLQDVADKQQSSVLYRCPPSVLIFI